MSVENANEVMKYYDTSLKILKDLVNENEIKAVQEDGTRQKIQARKKIKRL